MVICKICGADKKRLGAHVKLKHGITIEEYNLQVDAGTIGQKGTYSPVDQPVRVASETKTMPSITVKHTVTDPNVSELITTMKDQQAIELERYKLESIKDMRADLKTPKSERSGGVMDKIIGTVLPPLMNKFTDVDSGIKHIQENMDQIAQQVPEEQRGDLMDNLGGLIKIVSENPDIINNIFKQFFPK